MKSTLRVDSQERCNVSSAAEENPLMRRTIVNARGQVTIPAELRKQLGIKPGTRVTWFEEKGRLVLAPMTAQRIKDIRGFLKSKPGERSAFEESLKERARERRREDLKAAQ